MGTLVYGILLAIAIVLFLLEAFHKFVNPPSFSRGWLGLAFFAAAFLSQVIHP